MAFFESTSFEDAIRNAISLGGGQRYAGGHHRQRSRSYYGVPAAIRETALTYLPTELQEILEAFEARYPAPLRTTRTPGAPWPGAELYVQYEKSVSVRRRSWKRCCTRFWKTAICSMPLPTASRRGICGSIPLIAAFLL